ncbi:MAG TPA: hypothetical protein VHO67_21615 [Polyangia bacterium]|nr:hypothetical protein [Polyangia bacterium]
MRVVSQLFAIIAVLVDSPAARACPGCPTSRLVRQIVCGQHPWTNLAFTAAPFAVFAAIAWSLHRMRGPLANPRDRA